MTTSRASLTTCALVITYPFFASTITPEPAAICGCASPAEPKNLRKIGSRIIGFCSSGLFCSTAMFTTAGVTFSRTGASVGKPSRVEEPEHLGMYRESGANTRKKRILLSGAQRAELHFTLLSVP